MKKWITFVALTLVVLVGAASLSYARVGDKALNRTPIGWVALLELSDAQISAIQSILKTNRQQTLSAIQTLHENISSLRELQWSKDFTDEKAASMMESIRNARQELWNTHKANQEKIYNELTDEQKAKYDENCRRGQRNEDCDPPGDGSGRRGGRGGREKPNP